MAESAGVSYRKLPGRSSRKKGLFGGFSRYRLYLGPGHILAVENHHFSEDYKRFYFTDVQAIIVRKDRYLLLSALIQLLILLTFLGIGLSAHAGPTRVFWFVVSVVCLTILAINLLRGRTCSCHIVTAVQEDPLPSIGRVRIARKVVDRTLRPLIEAAQGTLGPGELADAHAAGLATRWHGDSAKAPAKPQESDGRVDYQGGLHIIAFSAFIASAILIGVDLLHHAVITMAASFIANMAGAVFIIIALIKQRGSTLSGKIRKVAWVAFAFACFFFLFGYCLALINMVQTHRQVVTQRDLYLAVFRVAPRSSPTVFVVYAVEAAGAFVTGLAGLALTLKHRFSRPAPADPHLIEETVYKA